MDELKGILSLFGGLSVTSILALAVWAMWKGHIVFKRELDRETERADKAEAALERFTPVIQTAIEALNRAPEVAHTAVETTAEVVKRRTG